MDETAKRQVTGEKENSFSITRVMTDCAVATVAYTEVFKYKSIEVLKRLPAVYYYKGHEGF